MSEQYSEAKNIIESSSNIKIYSHIDCDGICSGAILSTILDRQNKEHEIEFVNLDVLKTTRTTLILKSIPIIMELMGHIMFAAEDYAISFQRNSDIMI